MSNRTAIVVGACTREPAGAAQHAVAPETDVFPHHLEVGLAAVHSTVLG
ncbi:MAG: hypothetical protein P8N50_11000 [Actinomycetota bacterium]|jgi:hypothetical protein|nr:hypothetical protein [Actinomycetota bacterium]